MRITYPAYDVTEDAVPAEEKYGPKGCQKYPEPFEKHTAFHNVA
jgi:hypothetical protein